MGGNSGLLISARRAMATAHGRSFPALTRHHTYGWLGALRITKERWHIWLFIESAIGRGQETRNVIDKPFIGNFQ
jgi:hypothetical protein